MSGTVDPHRRRRRVAREVVLADEIAGPRAEFEARGDAVAAGHVENVTHLARYGLAGARGCRRCGGFAAPQEGVDVDV